jgi:hypothetical protein
MRVHRLMHVIWNSQSNYLPYRFIIRYVDAYCSLRHVTLSRIEPIGARDFHHVIWWGSLIMQVWMYLLLGVITWYVSEAHQTASLDSSGTANHVTRPCGSLAKLVRQQVQTPPERLNHVIQVLCSYWLEYSHVSWQQICIEICRHILRLRVGSRTGGLGQRLRIISSRCHHLISVL